MEWLLVVDIFWTCIYLTIIRRHSREIVFSMMIGCLSEE